MQECANMHLIMLVSKAFVHQLLDAHSRYSEKKFIKEGWKCLHIFNPPGHTATAQEVSHSLQPWVEAPHETHGLGTFGLH